MMVIPHSAKGKKETRTDHPVSTDTASPHRSLRVDEQSGYHTRTKGNKFV